MVDIGSVLGSVALFGAFLVGAAIRVLAAQWCRIHRSRQLAFESTSTPVEHYPTSQSARILLVGDSAAAGVGATLPRDSLAGRLRADYPNAQIINRAASGALLGDVAAQARCAAGRFDLVLLHAGGNDVLRLTSLRRMRAEAAQLLDELTAWSSRVVWIGSANFGLAPLFLPPFSWWISARAYRVSRLLRDTCQGRGAMFLDFHHKAGRDRFSRSAATYFAADGIHPSSHSYGHCYTACRRLAAFSTLPSGGSEGQPQRASRRPR